MKNRLMLLIVLICVPLSAQKYDPFLPVRDLLRSGAGKDEIISRLEQVGKTDFEFDGSYELFLAEYNRLLGTAHLLEKDRDKDAAKSALKTSIQYAEKINNQSESARALFYLASSGFLLAGAEGLGAIISESEKIYAYLDRALELTPEDPELILQRASGLAYPPKLFGGDPKKAIVLLERGLKVNNLYDYIRFDLLSTLSYCYQREGNNKEALDLANEALLLYPDNADLIKRQKELIKKVK